MKIRIKKSSVIKISTHSTPKLMEWPVVGGWELELPDPCIEVVTSCSGCEYEHNPYKGGRRHCRRCRRPKLDFYKEKAKEERGSNELTNQCKRAKDLLEQDKGWTHPVFEGTTEELNAAGNAIKKVVNKEKERR